MVKIAFFLAILIGIIVFPIIEITIHKEKKIYEVKSYIPIIIKKGKYFLYNTKLEKEGNFSVLKVYNKKTLEADDFLLKDLANDSVLISKTIKYTSPFLKGEKVKYLTKNYKIYTKFAIYNNKTKIVIGGEFNIYGESYKGFGENFIVDKENNVYAENIKYFLKVK